MTIKHSCQYCRAEIVLEIDDAYAALGNDPQKLIPRSCCNACKDLNDKRRRIEDRIERACVALRMLPIGNNDDRKKIRGALETLSRQYCDVLAQWRRMEGSTWDDQIVKSLMRHPADWGQVLSDVWYCRQPTLL